MPLKGFFVCFVFNIDYFLCRKNVFVIKRKMGLSKGLFQNTRTFWPSKALGAKHLCPVDSQWPSGFAIGRTVCGPAKGFPALDPVCSKVCWGRSLRKNLVGSKRWWVFDTIYLNKKWCKIKFLWKQIIQVLLEISWKCFVIFKKCQW